MGTAVGRRGGSGVGVRLGVHVAVGGGGVGVDVGKGVGVWVTVQVGGAVFDGEGSAVSGWSAGVRVAAWVAVGMTTS